MMRLMSDAYAGHIEGFAMFATLLRLTRTSLLLLVASPIAWTPASPAEAAAPRVRFDMAPCVEARDITTAEFTALSPRERLIEADFRISMLVTSGKEDDISEVFVVIESPEQRLRIVDFFPKNALFSDIAGTIKREEKREGSSTYDLGISATAGAPAGPVAFDVTPSIGAHFTQSRSASDCYEKLPPKKLVLAAGTTSGGHGVFFKLHPNSQDSLQGAHTYRVVFAAPANWRLDRVVLSCRATGTNKMLFVKQDEMSGQAESTISLYLAGDVPAQQAAQRLGHVQTPSASVSAARQSTMATRKALMFD